MKKTLLYLLFGGFVLQIGLLRAQESYKYSPKGAKKLRITNISAKLTIENHNGNDIQIIPDNWEAAKLPEKAKGLRPIGMGVQDNTGLGLNIKEEENGTIFLNPARKKITDFRILLPKNMSVTIVAQGWERGDPIVLENFTSEAEIQVEYNGLFLKNVSGPVIAKTTYGKIEASFKNINPEKPSSLVATYSDVDVSLPSDSQVNLHLNSNYGEIFTDFDIQFSGEQGSMMAINPKEVNGSINGGGAEIYIGSPYSDVYLRKKK